MSGTFEGGGGELSRSYEVNIPRGGYCDKDGPQKEHFKQMFANYRVNVLIIGTGPFIGTLQL